MKTPLSIILAAIVGWGAFLYTLWTNSGQTSDTPTVKVEYVDRVVEVEKIVQSYTASDKTKTTTFPSGVVVVETDKSTVAIAVEEKSKDTLQSKTVVDSTQTKFSAGFSVERAPTLNLKEPLLYRPEIGFRTWGNLWTTTSLTLDQKAQPKSVSVGLRLEF